MQICIFKILICLFRVSGELKSNLQSSEWCHVHKTQTSLHATSIMNDLQHCVYPSGHHNASDTIE